MPTQFVLFESALGYALFEVAEAEAIGAQALQAATGDLARFGKLVKLRAFQPFPSAEAALQNINDVSEGVVGEDLRAFLEANAPRAKAGKEAKFVIGVAEPKIGTAIQDALSLPCNSNETVLELTRGIRAHLPHFVRELAGGGSLEKAQLGLAHSYSRAKVKFNVNKADNMIIQAIAMLDQLDKDLNTFAMRIREWYSWHFPVSEHRRPWPLAPAPPCFPLLTFPRPCSEPQELARLVKDNTLYARTAQVIGSRSTLSEESLPALQAVLGDDEGLAAQILEASRTSMGMDISELDLANVNLFTARLVALARYRHRLSEYLRSKMATMAPNLSALIGDVVGARLISHAGSLTNLAKAPASTVQILGAEKALFRALKTKGNTPKYGLIFHSSFIGRAAAKNKGRISRYLANKCSIAARIDSFSEKATAKFGEKLRDQVEERLAFYETGAAPKRNAVVMQGVVDALKAEDEGAAGGEGARKGKKRKSEASTVDAEPAVDGGEGAGAGAAASKKAKKKKAAAAE